MNSPPVQARRAAANSSCLGRRRTGASRTRGGRRRAGFQKQDSSAGEPRDRSGRRVQPGSASAASGSAANAGERAVPERAAPRRCGRSPSRRSIRPPGAHQADGRLVLRRAHLRAWRRLPARCGAREPGRDGPPAVAVRASESESCARRHRRPSPAAAACSRAGAAPELVIDARNAKCTCSRCAAKASYQPRRGVCTPASRATPSKTGCASEPPTPQARADHLKRFRQLRRGSSDRSRLSAMSGKPCALAVPRACWAATCRSAQPRRRDGGENVAGTPAGMTGRAVFIPRRQGEARATSPRGARGRARAPRGR